MVCINTNMTAYNTLRLGDFCHARVTAFLRPRPIGGFIDNAGRSASMRD